MNIIFMGTPDFAVPTLEALISSRHNVIAVVTQPDKPKGRKGEPVFSPVKQIAVENDIAVMQPERIRNEEYVSKLKKMKPDVMIVVAFGQILSKEILDIPKYGCINVHASLLPKWRGAAPIQWSVISGDEETGVTIMQMNEGLDTGDILSVVKLPIEADETGGSLFDKLANMGGEALLKVLDDAEKDSLNPVAQGDSTTPYASMLKKEMGCLDFKEKAVKLERLIRGLYPWPGTYSYLDDKMLKIFEAQVISDDDCISSGIEAKSLADAEPGDILMAEGAKLIVKTSENNLKINSVQLAGKKRMDTEAFLRGYRIKNNKLCKNI